MDMAPLRTAVSTPIDAQVLDDELLCREELGEDEHLHEWVVLLLGELDEQLVQPLQLRVDALLRGLGPASCSSRSTVARSLPHRRELSLEDELELLVRIGSPRSRRPCGAVRAVRRLEPLFLDSQRG